MLPLTGDFVVRLSLRERIEVRAFDKNKIKQRKQNFTEKNAP
jgi:hypothetical protein